MLFDYNGNTPTNCEYKKYSYIYLHMTLCHYFTNHYIFFSRQLSCYWPFPWLVDNDKWSTINRYTPLYYIIIMHHIYPYLFSLSDRRSKYNEQIPMIHFILTLSIVLIIIINPDQSLVMLYDALEGAISELPLLKNKLEMIRKLAILFEGTS